MGVNLASPRELAAHGPVIPVLVIDRLADAVPMARALVEGGVRVLEVTLRTPVALQAIGAMVREVPQAIVGAGTLRDAAEVRAAHAAGAVFGVSPGYTRSVSQACREARLPLLPGVATAGELMAAREDGHDFVKVFPAAAIGGPALLRAWAGPFPEMWFCPTGGLTAATAPAYLALAQVPVCGGSWLTPADAVAAGDWARIRALAAQAHGLRGATA